MTNKHDDRLNKLEQWLEKYGEDERTVEAIRYFAIDMIHTCLDRELRCKTRRLVGHEREIKAISNALRDLANIIGVGLEDLEGP